MLLRDVQMFDRTVMSNQSPVAYVDWDTWQPRETGTLVFVIRGDEVLLIRKKRGLGAGKVNGPGGRLEPGEGPLACAIREVQEEVCITPSALEPRGELAFQFTDGYSLGVHVFVAHGFEGEPAETEEAVPFWTPLASLPYDEMWADDRLWFPLLITGTPFRGRFLFDGDVMLSHEIITPSA